MYFYKKKKFEREASKFSNADLQSLWIFWASSEKEILHMNRLSIKQMLN